MPFVFDTVPSSARHRAWRAYRRLTAPPLILMLLLAVFTAVLTSVMLVVSGPVVPLISLRYLAFGAAVGAILLFTFATTYYPYQAPLQSIKQILDRRKQTTEPVAIAPVLSFELMHLLASSTTPTDTNLTTLLKELVRTQAAQHILRRLELNEPDLSAYLAEAVLPHLSLDELSHTMLQYSHAAHASLVSLEHTLGALLLHPTMVPYLRRHKLSQDDITFTIWWATTLREREQGTQRWWDPSRLLHISGIGLSWSAGYTPLLDRFLRLPPGNPWDRLTASRQPYYEQVLAILARTQQANALLVGHPGGGRLGIVTALAHAVHHNEAHPALNNLRVVYIHLGEIVAQGHHTAGQLDILSQALREIERAGNIIVVLDGVSSLLGNNQSQSNLVELMRPFFSSSLVRTVTLLSPATYHSQFETREEMRHLFEVVQLPAASPASTLEVLALAIPDIEQRLHITIPYDALRALVDETDGILQTVPYPERAFDVLDEVLVLAQAQGRTTVDRALIQQHLARKTGIPLEQLRDSERGALLTLEQRLHDRIVNQRPAITAVVKALVRSRTGVHSRTRPIGTFFFLGPTGVGKTETTKALAQTYFGSEQAMVRFDMSEFQSDDSVAALIGTASRAGRLTSAIIDRPYTVILLDELEKAHSTVHQLLLPVLDEGRLTDGRGTEVSFRHSLIIATSNAGAEYIRESIGPTGLPPNFEHTLREYLLRQHIFAPEFLNRFDGVITFTPLTREHVVEVARRLLRQLNQRLDEEHGIQVNLTEELIEYVATIGYDPEFGARPLQRAIQNTVEYTVARRLVTGAAPPGSEITLSRRELEAAGAN